MKKLFYLPAICIIFTATFSSCKKDKEVSKITVEPKRVTLDIDETVNLTCIVVPYSADDKSVRWVSRNNSIATVSKEGMVTGITFGETYVIAITNDGHFSDSAFVKIALDSPKGDSIALVNLYKIATNLPEWDLTKPMDTWERVRLNDNRRVIDIHGSNYNYISINQAIDSSIGNLSCLYFLYLHALSPTPIPSEIGKLRNLYQLTLRGTFNGNIPKELGSLSKLELLYITETQVTGNIPQELENLKDLWELNLRYNKLDGTIPQSLLDRFSSYSFCPQNDTYFDNLDCSGYW